MAVAQAVVTSAWTPPPQITGFSGTAEEEHSHIMLNWDVSTLPESEFSYYRLYRRRLNALEWTILVDITDPMTMMYEDKTAGQRLDYEYMITQFKVVVGDVPLESDPSDIVFIALQSDAWFVVMHAGIADFHALELNVVSEEHSSVMQQEVFEPLASNRKRIVRGNVLGDEGSVTARFDTMDALMAKEHMEHIKQNRGPHILKSPFGDVWLVEFDAPGYKYLAGGHLEVTIGWVQIN